MKIQRKTILSLALMIACCTQAIAQTSANSIQPNDSPDAATRAVANDVRTQVQEIRKQTNEELIARIVREIKMGRAAVANLKAENASLRKQLDAEGANANSLSVSYEDAKREIANNEKAIGMLSHAVELNEQTIAILKSDNSRLRAEAKRARKTAMIATIVSVGTIALRFIR